MYLFFDGNFVPFPIVRLQSVDSVGDSYTAEQQI